MSVAPLAFVIAIVLFLAFSSGSFDVDLFDITIVVAIIGIALGIWFFAKGFGGE